MFPIRDSRGRVIGFGGRVIDQGEPKYMNSPETPLFHKGRELYGLYEARQARGDFKRLLIVEGYMDVVRLHQAGISYAVATLGTATTQEHLNKIFKMTSEVVFCFDGDRAGLKAAWRALENALPLAKDGRELKFMFLPEGHDPDSLVAEEGPEAFENRMRSALPLSEYLVQQLMAEVDLESVDGRAKFDGPGRPPVCPDAGRCLPGNARRSARVPGQHAGQQAQGIFYRRRARPAPPGECGGTRQAAGRSNECWAGQFADPGHHPGAAPPRAAAAAITDLELLGGIDKPGVSVLKELLEQAATAAHPNTAILLERWRERPEYERLTELATLDPLVAETASAAKELKMAVEKLLEEYGPGRRMDDLLKKAEELGLNYDEKAELSSLLKSKGRSRAPS